MSGIYIHIPFCIRKCKYCDFVSYADNPLVADYLYSLLKEIRLSKENIDKIDKNEYDTVFIGGGTPSVMPLKGIESIMNELSKFFNISNNAEISIECNPGTVDLSKLQEYKLSGINRLSLGLQSADDEILKRIGRIHTYAQYVESLDNARKAGFDNINTDIMHGLPRQTKTIYLDTIDKVCKLGVEHISSYSLILEENTLLYNEVMAGKEMLPDEDETYDMQDDGIKKLAEYGYIRYEVSNYSKHGRECRHNINYWENGEYLGLGLNSHSAMKLDEWTRWNNTSNLKNYIECLNKGKLPRENIEKISKNEEMFETVMVGFRMVNGIDISAFKKRYGISFEAVYESEIKELIGKHWLEINDERAKLTQKGMDMMNSALMCFIK